MEKTYYAVFLIISPMIGYIIYLVNFQKLTKKHSKEQITFDLKKKLLIIKILPIYGIISSAIILIIYFFNTANISNEIEIKIMLSTIFLVGLPSFFMCIGMLMLNKEAIDNIVKNPILFPKYLILFMMNITGVIYGLLSSIILFSGLGFLENSISIQLTIQNADMIFYSSLAYGILSSATILKGYLPTLIKIENLDIDYKKASDQLFPKKLKYAILPEIILIIELLCIILIYTFIGILN